MNKIYLLFFLIISVILAPSCDTEDPIPKYYFDKVLVIGGDLSDWDLLSGPDLQLSYGINTTNFESTVARDVNFSDLPVEWFFVDGLEVTNDNWVIKVVDVDDLNEDDLLIEVQFLGRNKINEGNPFILSNSNLTLQVYWEIR